MPALVIDASVAAAWCFADEHTRYTNAVLEAICAPLEAAVPRLWAYEVRNSTLMGLRRNRITSADAVEFMATIKGLPIRLRDPVSYDAVFNLAALHGLTVYDAAYLDLALREGVPLASLDNDLCIAAINAAFLYSSHSAPFPKAGPPSDIKNVFSGTAHVSGPHHSPKPPSKLVDSAKVQEWLGHANIATTPVYDHRTTRPEDSPTFRVAY